MTNKKRLLQRLNLVVCRCKGIPLSSFLDPLKEGKTAEELNQIVGSGTGSCQGRTCSPRILSLVAKRDALEKDDGKR